MHPESLVDAEVAVRNAMVQNAHGVLYKDLVKMQRKLARMVKAAAVGRTPQESERAGLKKPTRDH